MPRRSGRGASPRRGPAPRRGTAQGRGGAAPQAGRGRGAAAGRGRGAPPGEAAQGRGGAAAGRGGPAAAEAAAAAAEAAAQQQARLHSDRGGMDAETVPTPVVTPTNASGGPVDETAVLPRVPRTKDDEDASAGPARLGPRSESEVTTELPQPPVPPGAADETAVLPPVPPGAADETAVLPPVRPGSADETPAASERPGRTVRARSRRSTRERRGDGATPRPDWAEETPLDDLPYARRRTARHRRTTRTGPDAAAAGGRRRRFVPAVRARYGRRPACPGADPPTVGPGCRCRCPTMDRRSAKHDEKGGRERWRSGTTWSGRSG